MRGLLAVNVGEFGWALMNWQAHVRRIAKSFDHVVIFDHPEYFDLYWDFAHEFVANEDLSGTRAYHFTKASHHGKVETTTALSLCEKGMFDTFRFKGYEFLLAPCRPISVRECYKNQAFIKFGKVVPEKAYDVVIHARGRPHCADHNWPRERWEELIDKLTHEGLRCVAVGLMEASMGYFQLAADMRGVPLKETMDIIASSKVMVGPSSGPMCLSSLCGTPHVVWGDKGRYSGTTIKERFETAWNPFKTPCTVLDTGWQPSVDSVFKEVMEHVRKPKTTDESCKV